MEFMRFSTKNWILIFLLGFGFCGFTTRGAVQINPNPEKPPVVRQISYQTSGETTDVFSNSDWTQHIKWKTDWNLGQPGSYVVENCYGSRNSMNCSTQKTVWDAGGGPSYMTIGNGAATGSRTLGAKTETKNLKWSSQIELLTGGKSGSTRKSLFVLSATIGSAFKDPFTEFSPISPTSIQLGGMGALGTDGNLAKALGDNETHDITPIVKGPRYYFLTRLPQVWKYPFISTCYSPYPANRSRTTIGVGEQVSIGFASGYPFSTITYPVTWTTTAGSLSGNGGAVQLSAPARATNVTVTAKARGTSFSVDFSVIEPTGVDHATITSVNTYGNGVPGAGMHLNVFIAPTNVSFYRVQMQEIGKNASEKSGYFNTHTPLSHIGNGADVWHPIGYNNLIGDNMDNCFYAGSNILPSPWTPGGSFTWEIPALWRVGSTGATNSLSWSDQVFTLSANGTLMIQKFGHSVTRTIDNVISTQ